MSKADGHKVAIKHMKIGPEKKYKVILAYRELAILEFLSIASKHQKLPPLFTECLGVICPDEELEQRNI